MTHPLRTSARNLVPLLTVSALLLAFAAPAAADGPAEPGCEPAVALVDSLTPEAVLFGPSPLRFGWDHMPGSAVRRASLPFR